METLKKSVSSPPLRQEMGISAKASVGVSQLENLAWGFTSGIVPFLAILSIFSGLKMPTRPCS
jgi:hypothetical protein